MEFIYFYSSEGFTNHLSTVTSEAVAYRRIISERQKSHDEEEQNNHGIIARWSTPPKFGLSPPGNSRLAKRRSLKQKLSALSLSSTNSEDSIKNADSNNTTPVQSPDVGTPVNERIMNGLSKDDGPFSQLKTFVGTDISPGFSSGNSTPVREQSATKLFESTK